MTDLEQKIVKIIAEKLSVEESRVIAEASFVEDLRADSLDIVDVILALEDDFSIDIPDDDAQKLLTVGDAFNYVNSKVSAAS